MARRFNANAANYFEALARSPIRAYPLTIAAWTRPIATTDLFLSISPANGDARIQVGFNTNAVAVQVNNAANTSAIAISAAAVTGVWQHAAGKVVSTTSRTAYLNGVPGTTNTTSIDSAPSGWERVVLGARRRVGGVALPYNGDLADVAIWSIELTDREIAILATGVSPLRIRPSNLVAYWPLNGRVGSGEASLISRLDYATQFGTNPIVSDPLEALRNKAKSILPSFLIPSVTIPTLSSPTVINVTQTSATPRVTLTF